MEKRKALFLDRDGVINENRENDVLSINDVEIFPKSLEILRRIAHLPHAIIIVTNQAAIGRGIISLEYAQQINNYIVNRICQAGGRIDGVYMCPHTLNDTCSCRKPKPGMLFQAAQEHNLDLSQSLMLGDAYTDLLAGQSARIKNTILVLSGRGRQQIAILPQPLPITIDIYPDLATALTGYLDI